MQKAKMSTRERNDLPDSAFAYIEPGGEKDDTGRTKPRSKRKLPIHNESHVRNAIARFSQTEFHSASAKKSAARKIMRAARKYDVEVSSDSAVAQAAGSSKSVEIADVRKELDEIRSMLQVLKGVYKAEGKSTDNLDKASELLEKVD